MLRISLIIALVASIAALVVSQIRVAEKINGLTTDLDSTKQSLANSQEAERKAKKDAKDAKATKLSRRISARVGDFFKPKAKAEVASTAKVDEHPPKIGEPAPVAPLENVTEAAGEATAAETETAKPVEPAPAVTPAVAAAA